MFFTLFRERLCNICPEKIVEYVYIDGRRISGESEMNSVVLKY